ncbi:AraC family transcriptional regulator [Aequorivita sp. H23M31]|uniref:AraC family transcriptional regulator n=1 Tax=Aequorivita ciconiae TaxID=2494375 RepID=A0A410G5Y2_9FLAO|nr:helix-turn-helix domain-containing protein [Aequorivita sp. H23M31]QAA82698.1 AraC family transcriptional regulator [Aequorivita sp. H23M31]
MIQIEIHKEVIQIDWLVHQFESYRFQDAAIEDKFFPRPYVSLIFHFKSPALLADVEKVKLDPYFVAPIIPQAFNLEFKGQIDTFAVTCKATVFSRLFKIDMFPHLKRSIALPAAMFLPLWEEMAILESTEARISHFSKFIDSFQDQSYVLDAVDILYDKILERGPQVPLKEIFQECPASKSTLLRKFLKRTGVSPKTLVRIVRLNNIWTKISSGHPVSYPEMVYHGNYYDQSHFINDFSTIIGETPGNFFNRNLQNVKYFSGISSSI